jgi:phytoene dehydrogenase-like protein
LNSSVSEIVIENGTTSGIKLSNGNLIKSDVVVANADAKLVYEKLIPKSVKKAKRERRKLKKLTPSFSGFSLFIALDNSKISGEVPKLEHHNIYFPKDYDAEFAALFEENRPVADPTIYIAAPKDSKMVPNEKSESWSVLVNAPLHNPEGGVDWRKIEKEYAEKILDKLEDLGLRVRERMIHFEFRSPRGLAEEMNAPGGSIYGSSSNGPRAPFMRAKNRSNIKGLYIVGGSAHPGGGLPLVGMSAEIVAEAIG